MTAYSYVRFSHPSQKEGDSARRQIAAAHKWAKQNGHTLHQSLSFLDEAKSAFKGKHLGESGKLGLFLKMVDDGRIKKGSVLIVESFDRLSRLPIMEANRLFSSILERGIAIAFLRPERVLSWEKINKEPFLLIEVLVVGIRSNEESNLKASRVHSAWERKGVEARRGMRFRCWCPPWCEYKEGKYTRHPKHAGTVRRIFREYLEGEGCYRIARKLNAERVPTFGRTSEEWYKTIIRRILSDKRVLGRAEHLDKDDYYPAVVDEKDFYAVADKLARKPKGGRKNKGSLNLFQGLCHCATCGGSATRADKFRNGYRHEYLVCENGRTGKRCQYVSFKYGWLEGSFFNLIDSPHFYGSVSESTARSEQEHLISQLDEAERNRAKYWRLIEDDDDPSKQLADEFKKWERRVIELKPHCEQLKSTAHAVSTFPDELMELKNNLGKWLKSAEWRKKIREVIIRSTDRIDIYFSKTSQPSYSVRFRSGFVASVVVLPSPKSFSFQCREGTDRKWNPSEVTYG